MGLHKFQNETEKEEEKITTGRKKIPANQIKKQPPRRMVPLHNLHISYYTNIYYSNQDFIYDPPNPNGTPCILNLF